VSDTNGVSVLYKGNNNGIWTRRFDGTNWAASEQTFGILYAPVRGTP
jgi:hypothetical protein